MLNQNHPIDERLSALASHDIDATADATLTAHVVSCDRCTELVHDLSALRVVLADLPDLRPSRPLQLLPPVEADHATDRLGGWARRFFGPVLAAGAALTLVGTIGTTAPVLDQMTSGPDAGAAASAGLQELAQPEASKASEAAAGGEPRAADATSGSFEAAGGEGDMASPLAFDESAPSTGEERTTVSGGEDMEPLAQSSDRSPWPMVLFAGIALIIAAALMRWILAPRSG